MERLLFHILKDVIDKIDFEKLDLLNNEYFRGEPWLRIKRVASRAKRESQKEAFTLQPEETNDDDLEPSRH